MSTASLSTRVVLVTGAGQRVGNALARACMERGARVAAHFHQSRDGADRLVGDAIAAGLDAEVFPADLADPAAPSELIARVVRRFGALDVLVNSAAVMEQTPFADVTVAQWDRTMSINLRAPFFLAQAAAPHLSRSVHGGAIVNVADLAAFEVWPGYVPHGTSKNALVYVTRALAQMLAPGVRVNAIAPGAVLLPADWPPAAGTRLELTTPLGRLGSPADVVQAMLYLLEADFVTGQTIIVDGGRHVRR